jgi:hypothetical protein
MALQIGAGSVDVDSGCRKVVRPLILVVVVGGELSIESGGAAALGANHTYRFKVHLLLKRLDHRLVHFADLALEACVS